MCPSLPFAAFFSISNYRLDEQCGDILFPVPGRDTDAQNALLDRTSVQMVQDDMIGHRQHRVILLGRNTVQDHLLQMWRKCWWRVVGDGRTKES